MNEKVTKRIGDYEIIRELGHGGMGKVYEVRNVLTDRIEAMKVLLPDLAGRSEFVARFTREIKVLASLEHPNIAALRTAFSLDDQFVMVMEYVNGVTLADRLEGGAFPAGEALNYIDQVLMALSYSHGKHIIHRDVKPANMMLTPQGVVKLMDFGLARTGNEVGLTATGSTLGSLDYMAPEQVTSQPTDERSDLYAVGVSLYQMVTGKRMFSATSGYSLMQAQVKETPRAPIELQPTLPKSLSDLIMMAVAKDPAQRFQSADAFRNALSQIRESLAQPASRAQAAAVGDKFAAPAVAALSQAAAAEPAKSGPEYGVPAPSVPMPAQPRRDRGAFVIIAILLLIAVLSGAGVYKLRQHFSAQEATAAVTSSDRSAAPGTASSSSIATQPASPDSSGTSQAHQEGAAAAAPPSSPPTAAPVPALRKAANLAKASNQPASNPDTAGSSGGSLPDSQVAQPPAVDPKKLLDELETENDQLDSRAAAVESSLDALEQQMHRDGLGLRGDIVASRESLRTDLSKAKQAIDGADTDRARKYLDLAHREVEKLETFLGRR